MDTSHELRTPLTILRGEAELALRAPRAPDPPLRQALEVVVAQADHMGHLIEDLLYLARTEADDVRFERSPKSTSATSSGSPWPTPR